jgi:hypothetical protein
MCSETSGSEPDGGREQDAGHGGGFTVGIVLFCAAIAALMATWGYAVLHVFEGPVGPGEFGDLFGGLNAAFSGFAFVGVIAAIILQKRELALQREELRLTRKELAASRAEQAKSADAQKELVEKQLLTGRITGMAAIVQGRYQYASAHGANARAYVHVPEEAEARLLEFMQESGAGEMNLVSNMK